MLEPTWAIFRHIFSVLNVWHTPTGFHQQELSKLQVTMFLPTMQNEVQSTHASKDWGVCAPSTPVFHICSSSGRIGSACFLFTPTPFPCSFFMTPSSVRRKPSKSGSVKKLILGFFPLTHCMIPQHSWYNVFGGYGLPSCWDWASTTNLLNQWSTLASCTPSDEVATP